MNYSLPPLVSGKMELTNDSGNLIAMSINQLTTLMKIAEYSHGVMSFWQYIMFEEQAIPWQHMPATYKEYIYSGILYLCNKQESVKEQHDSWEKYYSAQGWTRGDDFNYDAKTHPNLLPFEDVSPVEKTKIILFRTVVTTVASQLGLIQNVKFG